MATMFDTSITTPIAEQQATQGVPSAAVGILGAVVQGASNIAVPVTNRMDLTAAEESFTAIDAEFNALNETLTGIEGALAQGLASGNKKTQLQVKARSELQKAKANNPRIANKLDQLYASKFGAPSGGTTSGAIGAFALTPQEQAAKKIQEETTEYSMRTGLSMDEAFKAQAIATQATQLKSLQTITGQQASTYTATTLQGVEVDFYEQLKTSLDQGGGTITAEQAKIMGQQLTFRLSRERAVFVQKAGNLSPDEMDRAMKRYDDKEKALQTVVNNQTYAKWVTENNALKTAEATSFAIDQAPQLFAIKTVFGDQVLNTMVEAITNNNPKQLAHLKARTPGLQGLLDTNPNYPREAVAGYFNNVSSTPANGNLVEMSAQNKLSPDQYAITADIAANEPKLASLVMSMKETGAEVQKLTEANPDAMVSITYNNSVVKTSEEYKQNTSSVWNGMKNAFLSGFRSSNNKFPTNLKVVRTSVQRPEGPLGGFYIPSKQPEFSYLGDGLTPELKSQLGSMVRSIEANRGALPDSLKDMPTEQIVELWANADKKLSDVTVEDVNNVSAGFWPSTTSMRIASSGRAPTASTPATAPPVGAPTAKVRDKAQARADAIAFFADPENSVDGMVMNAEGKFVKVGEQ